LPTRSWCADASGCDQLKIDAGQAGADAALVQRFDVASNTMTELGKLAALGGTALLLGGDAQQMQLAMGTAQNAVQNNRQLHPDERILARKWAAESGGKFTAAQIENALRNSGNKDKKESIITGVVVDTGDSGGVYDGGAVFKAGAQGTNTIIQQLPDNGLVDPTLASFILNKTGGTASPYAWSNAQLGVQTAAPGQSTTTTAGGDPVRYANVMLGGYVYSLPVVDCPAASCQKWIPHCMGKQRSR
jgi:hypothetical protein